MVDMIEKSFDININYKLEVVPAGEEVCSGDCVSGSSVGPEPIAVSIEFCLTDRFQDLKDTLLNQPVLNRGNAKGPHSSIWLWNLHPAYRVRGEPIQAVPHIGYQYLRIFPRNRENCTLIDTLCLTAPVLLDIAIGE